MKNSGISLIALIITIIVIIILAAVVIGSALSTPETANWARFCQDYSEIQSAIQVQYATLYGDYSVGGTGVPTKAKIYGQVATGSLPAEDPAAPITMTAPGFAALGLTVPSYSQVDNWTVDQGDGELIYAPGFTYDGSKYITPVTTTTP